MICPNCGSENVSVQMVTETKLKKQHHGIIYWLFIGWWLQPLLWICFFLPMVIIAIFKPKSYKTKIKHKSMAVCQDCGHHWNV